MGAPSRLRRHPERLTVTLLTALVRQRELEITDALLALLIATVHRIGVRAVGRVWIGVMSEFCMLSGKLADDYVGNV